MTSEQKLLGRKSQCTMNTLQQLEHIQRKRKLGEICGGWADKLNNGE